jgi:hypothetical protein
MWAVAYDSQGNLKFIERHDQTPPCFVREVVHVFNLSTGVKNMDSWEKKSGVSRQMTAEVWTGCTCAALQLADDNQEQGVQALRG